LLEGDFVGPGWHREPAELAHKLQGRVADLEFGGWPRQSPVVRVQAGGGGVPPVCLMQCGHVPNFAA
jgi:hypothetical protein